MKFFRAQTNINLPIVRFVSENGRWEVGIWPVLFGLRVRAGIMERDWANVDYCAGNNPAFALQLLVTVMEILEALPEEISGGDVEAMMPSYERRPINLDPCWQKLRDLSGRLANERRAA